MVFDRTDISGHQSLFILQRPKITHITHLEWQTEEQNIFTCLSIAHIAFLTQERWFNSSRVGGTRSEPHTGSYWPSECKCTVSHSYDPSTWNPLVQRAQRDLNCLGCNSCKFQRVPESKCGFGTPLSSLEMENRWSLGLALLKSPSWVSTLSTYRKTQTECGLRGEGIGLEVLL